MSSALSKLKNASSQNQPNIEQQKAFQSQESSVIEGGKADNSMSLGNNTQEDGEIQRMTTSSKHTINRNYDRTDTAILDDDDTDQIEDINKGGDADHATLMIHDEQHPVIQAEIKNITATSRQEQEQLQKEQQQVHNIINPQVGAHSPQNNGNVVTQQQKTQDAKVQLKSNFSQKKSNNSNNQLQYYSEPPQKLLEFIAHKVEPQSKVYLAQQSLKIHQMHHHQHHHNHHQHYSPNWKNSQQYLIQPSSHHIMPQQQHRGFSNPRSRQLLPVNSTQKQNQQGASPSPSLGKNLTDKIKQNDNNQQQNSSPIRSLGISLGGSTLKKQSQQSDPSSPQKLDSTLRQKASGKVVGIEQQQQYSTLFVSGNGSPRNINTTKNQIHLMKQNSDQGGNDQKFLLINEDLLDDDTSMILPAQRKSMGLSKRGIKNNTQIGGSKKMSNSQARAIGMSNTSHKRYTQHPSQVTNQTTTQAIQLKKQSTDAIGKNGPVKQLQTNKLNTHSSENLDDLLFTQTQQGATISSNIDFKRIAPLDIDNSRQHMNQISQGTSLVEKNDILIANQVSNESLLSKTDILESAMASKRALPPKFNASGSPFQPIDQYNKNKRNKTKGVGGGLSKGDGGLGKLQKQYGYKVRRRRRDNKKDLYETAIDTALLDSMASKDATMTLECIESRDGGDHHNKNDMGQTSHPKIMNSSQKVAESSGNQVLSMAALTLAHNTNNGNSHGQNNVGTSAMTNVKDINMQINLLMPMELNEVQTTASLLKIRPKEEVHKNLKLKKGPAGITQQSMQLFNPTSPKAATNRNSPNCNNITSPVNGDLNLTAQSQLPASQKKEKRQHQLGGGRNNNKNSSRSPKGSAVHDKENPKRAPFDLRSQMISEITELMSKDSCTSNHLINEKLKKAEQQRQHYNVNSGTDEGSSAVASSNYSHSVLSRDSGGVSNSNQEEPLKSQKPYIGPLSLKPTGKETVRQAIKPVVVNNATKTDKKFRASVQDCVKTMRLNKEQKHQMIKLLNQEFRQTHQQRLNSMSPTKKEKQTEQQQQLEEMSSQHSAHMKSITNQMKAVRMTESRNIFAKERKSLPTKLNNPKPILLQQGSPVMRYAPNQIKMEKFGGRFFTDTRRAFSLGIPVPPGPLPRKPVALMLGRRAPLHDHKDNVAHFLQLVAPQSPAKLHGLNSKSNQKKSNKKIFSSALTQQQNMASSSLPQPHHINCGLGGNNIPEFIDAIEAKDSGERGFSAFTKSANMDMDTQTNFNIIEYEDFKRKRADEKSSLLSHEAECTCDQNKTYYSKQRASSLRQAGGPRTTTSQIQRDIQESKEWLELANQIVQKSEQQTPEHETEEGGTPVMIPMKLMSKHSDLENLELDEDKVLEIKQALTEYTKLKELEERQEDEQKLLKEYQQSRSKLPKGGYGANVQSQRQNNRNQHPPMTQQQKQSSPQRKNQANQKIATLQSQQNPTFSKRQPILTFDSSNQGQGTGTKAKKPTIINWPSGMPHIMTSDEDTGTQVSEYMNETHRTFQIFRRSEKCPIHDTKNPHPPQRMPLKLHKDSFTGEFRIQQDKQQKLFELKDQNDGGIIATSPNYVRQFNKTVNFAGSVGSQRNNNPMIRAMVPISDNASFGGQDSLTSQQHKNAKNKNIKGNKYVELNIKSSNEDNIDIQKRPEKQESLYIFDSQKVDANRERIQEIKNVLVTQYEKQNTSLEQNLRSQVDQTLQNMPAAAQSNSKGRSSFFKDGENINEDNGLGKDKKGQMLEKLKEMKKSIAANLDIQKKQVMQTFLSGELQKGASQAQSSQLNPDQSFDGHHYLPAIGQNQKQHHYHINQLEQQSFNQTNASQMNMTLTSADRQQRPKGHILQLNDEMQQFERRNKLVSRGYKQKKDYNEKNMQYGSRNMKNDSQNHQQQQSNADESSIEGRLPNDSDQYQILLNDNPVDKTSSFTIKNVMKKKNPKKQFQDDQVTEENDSQNAIYNPIIEKSGNRLGHTKSIYSKLSGSPLKLQEQETPILIVETTANDVKDHPNRRLSIDLVRNFHAPTVGSPLLKAPIQRNTTNALLTNYKEQSDQQQATMVGVKTPLDNRSDVHSQI